ncbi:MAG: type II secretion system F family protein [Planctomycetota bacterium]|nr:MAG: type II secretion system F family protein [Planctomycetota bacterium]
MKSYKYIARDSSGHRKEGLREALASNDVLAWLREQALIPISVNEMSLDIKQSQRKTHRKHIKSADMSTLCWQLTTMVEGGIPITTALETISEDIENLRLQQVLQQIVDKMHKGVSFSDSISEYPKIFNRLSCAMLLAGETGGNLPEALRRLAEYFDGRDKLAKKVKGAMAYPIFVLSFIVLIVAFIMGFIIPRFRTIFDQFGGKLPAFTQAFMSFYDGLKNNLVYIIGFIFILVVFCMLSYSKSKKGHYIFSKIALSLPLLGKIFSQAFITTFCRTMATLVGAGVSVLEVLDILVGMTNNDIIKDAIIQTREHIVGGANISFSMASAGFFPNMVVKMIQVGEESGSLPKVLERTSNYYERKVDSTITTVISLLEPLMIVTVGAIVLVVVLALYLPIFSMKAG